MIRKQIMALLDPIEYKDYNTVVEHCADLAEAREKELLAQIEAIKLCADAFEFDAECRKDLLAMQKAERAQMIAELRESILRANENQMPWDELQPFVYCETLEAIINKYEVKK